MKTLALDELSGIQGLTITRDEPLRDHTRFGLGGQADLFIDAAEEQAFIHALRYLKQSTIPYIVIGGGSNLVCADNGYRGAILRFTGAHIEEVALNRVHAEAGAVLQHLVDFTLARGYTGIHTMTGIPGWVGGAIYGNAGAYGTSIHNTVHAVRFWDGEQVRTFNNTECEFAYRESIFKRRKDWTIFTAQLTLGNGDAIELQKNAAEILAVRNAKYPPDMKCAGSIFKNLFFAQLPPAAQAEVPPNVIREGKVPSAWFLEQVDAKGIVNGGIEVATYHANLIYNTGSGTAAQVREIINDLKRRIQDRFHFAIEEEVQYIGF